MWEVREVEERPGRMVFTTSPEGEDVRQLFADGELVADALSYANYQAGSVCAVQVMAGYLCGYPYCSDGGWLGVRRAGEYCLLIPLFQELMLEMSLYTPPAYVHHTGGILLDARAYAAFRKSIPALPVADDVAPLREWEALRLIQWEAPACALGEFLGPVAPDRRLILAASEGDANGLVTVLGGIVSEARASARTVSLRPIADGERAPVLYLDTPEFDEWRCLASVEGGERLFLEPRFVVEPVD